MAQLDGSISSGQLGHITDHEQIAEKLGAILDVKADFGATGDGVTDDTAAIQAALDLLGVGNLGGTCFFPRGVYVVTGLRLPPRVSLRGVGFGTSSGQGSSIHLADGANQHIIRSSLSSGSHHASKIADLMFDGNGDNQTTDCDVINLPNTGEGCSFEHLFIRGAYRHGIYITTGVVPGFFSDLHLFSNGRSGAGSGIRVDKNGSTIADLYLEMISGDSNKTSLIEVNGGGTVTIVGFKSEPHAAGSQQNTILLTDFDAGHATVIGGITTGSITSNAVIRVTHSAANDQNMPQVVWFGISKSALVTYIYEDAKTGETVTTNSSGTSNIAGFATRPRFQHGLRLVQTHFTPQTAAQDTEANLYMRGNKLIVQFKDGETVRYKYLPLTGTDVTWVHTTTAP